MAEGFSDDGWVVVQVPIPPELVECGVVEDLQRFFDAMIYKFRRNAHKGRWEDLKLYSAFGSLRKEVDELNEALKAFSTAEIWMEAADVANTALIVAAIALEKARPTASHGPQAPDQRPGPGKAECRESDVAPRRLADQLEDFGEKSPGLQDGGAIPGTKEGRVRPGYRRCVGRPGGLVCICDADAVVCPHV